MLADCSREVKVKEYIDLKWIFLVILCFTGCATSLSQRGRKVKIIFDIEFIKDRKNTCKHLGNIEHIQCGEV